MARSTDCVGSPPPPLDTLRREDTGDDEGEDGGDEKGKQKIKKYKARMERDGVL